MSESTAASVLHNLGLTMACHRFPCTYVPGLLRYALYHPCRQICGVAHLPGFGLFTVVAFIAVVENTVPDKTLLNGKTIRLAVPWAYLSVSLNIVLTSMICVRILRMRALAREAVCPEMSRLYTSVVAMLVESAAPLSIFGIAFAVASIRKSPLAIPFGNVWTKFCVESCIVLRTCSFLRVRQR